MKLNCSEQNEILLVEKNESIILYGTFGIVTDKTDGKKLFCNNLFKSNRCSVDLKSYSFDHNFISTKQSNRYHTFLNESVIWLNRDEEKGQTPYDSWQQQKIKAISINGMNNKMGACGIIIHLFECIK